MAKLIVGLGNPGSRYAQTRHNVGWMALDAFAQKHSVALNREGHHGVWGQTYWGDAREKVVLLKPLTFMNHSGRSVAAAARFYKIPLKDILIVYDDMDLPPGRLRLREKGSAGGHNGMKSIIQELGGQEFPRLRIGIGRPAPLWSVTDWVLAPFGEDDAAEVAAVLPRAVEAIEAFLDEGIRIAMTRHNG